MKPTIYNGAPGYHVWLVGKLSNLSLISPSNSSSTEQPKSSKKATVAMSSNLDLQLFLLPYFDPSYLVLNFLV